MNTTYTISPAQLRILASVTSLVCGRLVPSCAPGTFDQRSAFPGSVAVPVVTGVEVTANNHVMVHLVSGDLIVISPDLMVRGGLTVIPVFGLLREHAHHPDGQPEDHATVYETAFEVLTRAAQAELARGAA